MTDADRLAKARALIDEALGILDALSPSEDDTPNRPRREPAVRNKRRSGARMTKEELTALVNTPREDRRIGESGIVDAEHPDVVREAAASDEELEARVTMRKLRESGVIETAPETTRPEITVETDDDLIG